MKRAFVLLRQAGRNIDEPALALLASATAIADEVIALLLWHDDSKQCPADSLRGRCHEAWIVRGEGLRHADGSALGRALAAVLPPRPVLLMHHDSFAMDTGPGASIILNVPFASNVVSLEEADDGVTRLGRKEYGGQIQAVYELNHSLGC
jgi:electron transfer flavoprotein alpha subunit